MTLNLDQHPCFNAKARHDFGRVHLPIAPKCNIQCNYCNRKYDCANESRPGVTSTILTPGQAMVYLDKVVKDDPRITVVGIAGPGDPFANPVETMDTLRRVRAKYPKMILCVASNGLNLAPYAEELVELEVSHVTVTLNTLDPEIGAQLYAWVRDGKRIYHGREAAELLLERQLDAIKRLKDAGMVVKINTIIVPGVNDTQALEVAKEMGKMGIDMLNCLPLYPAKGSAFESLPEPTPTFMGKLRVAAAEHVSQMSHCARCRADAVGLLCEGKPKTLDWLAECANMPVEPEQNRPRIAVASREGLLVNQHLGEATALNIYEEKNGQVHFIEKRETPPAGGGDDRWLELAKLLDDCCAVLVGGAGGKPTATLEESGVKVILTEGLIEPLLKNYYEGKPLPRMHKQPCGVGCAGDGTGCG